MRKMAEQQPARYVIFDILARGERSVMKMPLEERRQELEAFMRSQKKSPVLVLGRVAHTVAEARKWIGHDGLNGVMVKQRSLPYLPGRRAMQKYKIWKTIDCVVGGMYLKKGRRVLESILLGLYGADGLLLYVRHARIPSGSQGMLELLETLASVESFTGCNPGTRDRWSGSERDYVP